jgi:hypothetical protein
LSTPAQVDDRLWQLRLALFQRATDVWRMAGVMGSFAEDVS